MTDSSKAFFKLCLVAFLARLSYQMGRTPALPRFAQDLGASPEWIGWIVAASTITGIFIKVPAGVLSDIFGRRKMILVSAFFFALTPFFYLAVHTPGQLLALRFLHGFATAIFSPVASAFVVELFEKSRGEKIGWFAAANELGSTAGPLLGGLILFWSSSFSITYLSVAFCGLLPLLVLWRLGSHWEVMANGCKENPSWRQAHTLFVKGVKEIVWHRSILIAGMMEACLFLGIAVLIAFLPLYARTHGMNEAQVGVLLGIQLIAGMAGKPLTGKLSDRLGRKPMIVFGLILCASTLPLIALTYSFWPLLSLCLFFGFGMAIVTPSTTALVADLCHNRRYGSAMGVFGTIWDMGEAAGPILAGILIGSLGYLPAFSIIAGMMVIGALFFTIFVKDPVPTHSKGEVVLSEEVSLRD